MGNLKRDCKKKRKEWAEYVSSMMETTGFEPELFGRWEVVVRDWRSKNSSTSPATKTQTENERQKLIDNIVGTLEDQKKAYSVGVEEESGEKSSSREPDEVELVEVGEKADAKTDQFTLVERKKKGKNLNKPAELSVEQILTAVAAGHLGVGKPGRPRKLTTRKAQPPKQKNLKKKSKLAAQEEQSEDVDEPPEDK